MQTLRQLGDEVAELVAVGAERPFEVQVDAVEAPLDGDVGDRIGHAGTLLGRFQDGGGSRRVETVVLDERMEGDSGAAGEIDHLPRGMAGDRQISANAVPGGTDVGNARGVLPEGREAGRISGHEPGKHHGHGSYPLRPGLASTSLDLRTGLSVRRRATRESIIALGQTVPLHAAHIPSAASVILQPVSTVRAGEVRFHLYPQDHQPRHAHGVIGRGQVIVDLRAMEPSRWRDGRTRQLG